MLFIYTAGCMFLFCKKEILLFLFVQLRKSPRMSCNSVESPGKVLELWCKKSCKKWKNVLESPGKSWNLNQFFCWEPWIPHFLPLIVLNTEQRVIFLKKNWKLYIIYVNRKIYLSKRLTKATLLYYLLLLAVVLAAKIPDTEYHRLQTNNS